ncbi:MULTISPECIES: glucose-6-phosphate dehydrogenase [unclassified Streptomyces]|uniref:glucose-6-phosphate dehydrogenase n=1 Tax=unclassified Streptomyces TaxID=2593676 RepID=UPI002E8131FE|nr:glucose-6-phosphate dehydrogenase [Streptomyces sp. NBC_00562]WTD31750.1 glucose-6-phosphate dehydrogenase [Streptomyces sp. NBC_01643]WUC18358.1 glucose-6-phosphate dehydrogenase [Streptomyces sp. NBC_00562]
MTSGPGSESSGPVPEDHVIVLFGATGDLARRKLLPGLFHLAKAGLLPARYRIVGSAPSQAALSDDDFRKRAREAVAEFGRSKPEGPEWQEFEEALTFGAADPDDPEPLLSAVRKAEQAVGGRPRRLFHLAVPPTAFASVIEMLGATGLAENARVIVEKPFGTDLPSAQALNATIHSVFDESRTFRIDHFLGKESVDNILALRFANGLFEPIWNRDHISHVQIDVPEKIGIEGRAQFFEGTGTFRDMIVTHLFQLMGFMAMEPPAVLTAKSLRDEKEKVFQSLRQLDPAQVVRGQYEGYRDEPGVDPRSDTETFIALRVELDNWRWAGVPFFLRSGKSLGEGRHVVTLGFREPALRMFPLPAQGDSEEARNNELVIDFDDPGRIATRFLVKEPGPAMRLEEAGMVFDYGDSFNSMYALEGYERLILDAMLGDQSLFTRSDGIERLWEASAPLLANPPQVEPYTPGSWGPESIDRLIAPYRWSLPDRR